MPDAPQGFLMAAQCADRLCCTFHIPYSTRDPAAGEIWEICGSLGCGCDILHTVSVKKSPGHRFPAFAGMQNL